MADVLVFPFLAGGPLDGKPLPGAEPVEHVRYPDPDEPGPRGAVLYSEVKLRVSARLAVRVWVINTGGYSDAQRTRLASEAVMRRGCRPADELPAVPEDGMGVNRWERRMQLYEADVREPVAYLDWEGVLFTDREHLPHILFAEVPVTIKVRYELHPDEGLTMIVPLAEAGSGTGPNEEI